MQMIFLYKPHIFNKCTFIFNSFWNKAEYTVILIENVNLSLHHGGFFRKRPHSPNVLHPLPVFTHTAHSTPNF